MEASNERSRRVDPAPQRPVSPELRHAIQGPLDTSLALARLAWGAAAGRHRTPEQAVREQRSMQLGSMLVDAPAHHPLPILRRHLAHELAAVLAKV